MLIKRKYINYTVEDVADAFRPVAGTMDHPFSTARIPYDQLHHLPELVMFADLMREIGNIGKWYVAGSAAAYLWGKINGVDVPEPRDVDIYFYNPEDLYTFEDGMKRVYTDSTEAAHTYKYERRGLDHKLEFLNNGSKFWVQVAVDTKWHVPPAELMEHFDYTICMFSILCEIGDDGLTTAMYCLSKAPDDLKEKELNIHSTMTPKDSCYRAMKYLQSGYKMGKNAPDDLVRSVKNQIAWGS